MSGQTVAQEHCPECGQGFLGRTAAHAERLVIEHAELEHDIVQDKTEPVREERPKRRIRWTVTGYGAPIGTRKETWTALLDIVALAEHRGLRVEVTEVEEEDR